MPLPTFLSWFHPSIDAFLCKNIPFHFRWRLLLFQPLALLIYAINGIPSALFRRSTTIYIPVRNGLKIRALMYRPPTQQDQLKQQELRPLHLDMHGGAFMGGHPEASYRFCTALSDRTNTIVVSTTYRFAPLYPFPAAIDDVDDVVDWLLSNAEKELGADMNRFTIGGSSAGANLALATSLREDVRSRVKGVVTFYAPIDVSTPPTQKPKPPQFPKRDPMSFLLPLYDAYGRSGRLQGQGENARLSPCKAPVEQLPDKILMVVPMIDILPAEQLKFAERVNSEREKAGFEKKVELMIMEKCFHGWLELPDAVIDKATRTQVFDKCIAFIQDVQGRLA